ncbi:uncharacterized protein LOC143063835 [Mytilus galloprovincialis]|uniref:uncharacterized protein LOC143063835 n=1 Tax=Mytilus galloprovincialis TaxID=29158 RepID=UPI003F7B6839
MVLDIMSAPKLPARVPSQRGRPLPETPNSPSHLTKNQPSLKNRALPPPPEQNANSSPNNHVSQTPRRVAVPNSLNTGGQTLNKRPLPPPPAEDRYVSSPITPHEQNSVSTLRRGLPPVPNESSTSESQKRPLPPPPTNETKATIQPTNQTMPQIPPNIRSLPKQTANGNVPTRSTNLVSNALELPPKLPARKSSVSRSHGSPTPDLETRFLFHNVKDFPQPEEYQGQEKKYPSQSETNVKTRRRKRTSPR